ncbi:MAG: glycosyltransferase family 39 protein [Myxococcota bacterium]
MRWIHSETGLRVAAFGFFLLVYLLTARGYFDTIDVQPSLLTAQSLLERGSPAISAEQLKSVRFFVDDDYLERAGRLRKGEVISQHGYVLSHQGLVYSWHDLGQPLYLIPFIGLGEIAHLALGGDDEERESLIEFAVAFQGCVAGALLALLAMVFCRRLGHSCGVSLSVAILTGLGTMLWYYSTSVFRDVLLALLVLAATFYAFRFSQTARSSDTALSAVFVGAAVLTKQSVVIIAPVLLAFVAYAAWQHRNRRALVTFCLVGGTFAAAVLGANYLRFGGPFQTGHVVQSGLGGGDIEILAPGGVAAMLHWTLTSLEKGLFVHNPLLLVSLFALPSFYRQRKPLFWMFAGLVLTAVLVHSLIQMHDPNAWGPRFLLVIIPLLTIPLAGLLQGGRVLWKATIAVFFAIALVLNVVTVIVSPREYQKIRTTYVELIGPDTEDHYTPPQIVGIFPLLREKLTHTVPIYQMDRFGDVAIDARIDMRPYQYWWGLDLWYLNDGVDRLRDQTFVPILGWLLAGVLGVVLIGSCRAIDRRGMGEADRANNGQ